MKRLGRLIDDEIKRRGITIAELARRCQCERNTIYNVVYTETYDPRLSTIIKLCEELGLDIDSLAKAHKIDYLKDEH